MDSVSKLVIIILGYIFTSIMGLYFVRWILGKYEENIEDCGLKRAGMVIGIIERFLVFTFVLLSQYTAITIIFAAKSIARFNELKKREIAEYYLIGTLSSITFALITGVIVQLIVEETI